MNRGTLRTIGAILAGIVITTAMAAQLPAKDIVLGRKLFMLLKPEVTAELKITKDQSAKIQKATGGAATTEGGKVRVKMGPGTDFGKMESECFAVLTSGQRVRLDEIWIQRNGALAVCDATLASKCGVTKDQIKKIEAIIDNTMHDMMEGAREGNQIRLTSDSTNSARKAGIKQAIKVLTADQLKKLDALKGAPFKFND